MRCDCCGKFRKYEDLLLIDYTPDSEYSSEDYVYECRFCMSKSDLERYDSAFKQLKGKANEYIPS